MTGTAPIDDTSSYSDLKLIEMFKNGNDSAFDALTNRYLKLISSITSKYNIAGLELEDLTQEGLLGLLSAVNSYKTDAGTSFKTYAGLCINRRIVSLLKRSGGNRNKPLNDYISLYDDDVEQSAPDDEVNPENLVISREGVDYLNRHISDCLSKTEKCVLDLYLAGESYTQISDKLSVSVKSVDNALQRIRKKLKTHISKNMPL